MPKLKNDVDKVKSREKEHLEYQGKVTTGCRRNRAHAVPWSNRSLHAYVTRTVHEQLLSACLRHGARAQRCAAHQYEHQHHNDQPVPRADVRRCWR